MTSSIAPESVTYFHGKITRENAEDLLTSRGGAEGLFLLRESAGGNFAVSICHSGRVHHYNVEKQTDGSFQIPTGRKFIGPVELVHHHSEHLDGFLTLARVPLDRPPTESPIIYQGVTANEFEELLRLKAADMNLKGNSIDEVLAGPMRDHLSHLVLKDLHLTQPWYHDAVKRKESEARLAESGHVNGNYLVRFRKEDDSFVLSLSYQAEAKHYKIEKRMNKLSIEGGKFFDTLMELIDHYHFRQDGLLCKLRKAVEAPGSKSRSSRSSLSSRSSFSETSSTSFQSPSRQWGKATPPQQESFQPAAGVTATANQHSAFSSVSSSQWPPTSQPGPGHFHSASATPTTIHLKGKAGGSSATGLTQQQDLISFADWPNVTSLLSNQGAVVPFGHQFPPLSNNSSIPTTPSTLVSNSNGATPLAQPPTFQPAWPTSSSAFGPGSATTTPFGAPVVANQSSAFVATGRGSLVSRQLLEQRCQEQHILDMPVESLNCPPIIDETWNEPDGSEDQQGSGSGSQPVVNSVVLTIPNNHPTTGNALDNIFSEDTQVIYDSLPRNEGTFHLRRDQLVLKEKLGGGNFGCVLRGSYRTPEGKDVPVAVKMLKEDQTSLAGEREILIEARNMSHLKHRHIVRLLGVCKDTQVMLILELAPFGPINKYLRRHLDTPIYVIAELVHQVAQGMAYLESCKFVHRDLAARNVLLVNKHFAKISDFGMSKALNYGNDYYRAASAGKWPLKWYAPECIYYFRFDSKSDVWSYGVTLWESFSYGDRPYRDMKGTQILAMLDQGLRLSKPPRCPETVYEVMRQCWHAEGVRRPTFAELVLTMSRIQIALNKISGVSGSANSTPSRLPGPPVLSGQQSNNNSLSGSSSSSLMTNNSSGSTVFF